MNRRKGKWNRMKYDAVDDARKKGKHRKEKCRKKNVNRTDAPRRGTRNK